MTNDFLSYNVIYIVYDRKNENHWSLLIIRYLLLITWNTNSHIIYITQISQVHPSPIVR